MTELLTAAQMRAIEEAAIASGKVTGLELMERAGAGVVEAIFEEWPELAEGDRRAVVLCGPGNNGGDGFVVARLLKDRGWEVEVFLYGDPAKLPPDARANYERWCQTATPQAIEKFVQFIQGEPLDYPAILVDAMFGTGLARPPEMLLKRVFRDIHTCRFGWGIEAKVISIDIPSGLCADSGRTLGASHLSESIPDESPGFNLQDCVDANLTISFHREKLGHRLADGPNCCGEVRVADIGLDVGSFHLDVLRTFHGVPRGKTGLGSYRVYLAEADDPQLYLAKDAIDHKYTHGHALILSGGPGKGGAARLSARGALRIGAGLVTLGCPPAALQENAAQLNAIMLTPIKGAGGLSDALSDPRITALCLGPGMGLDQYAEDLVAAALSFEAPDQVRGGHPDQVRGGDKRKPAPAEPAPAKAGDPGPRPASTTPRPTVLDADALTILARNPALFAALHQNCVLTPHAGEFARLFPEIAAKLDAPATEGPAYSKVDATREAAARAGCVVLFKGPDTVIAAPDGRCSINSAHYDRAAPWLATAGSGDVLAGFITGLLARGFPPMQAAEAAAWLHVECALKFGPGLIAEDIPEALPAVFRDLGL